MADNRIALLAQAPVFDTPFESQGKALQLRQLMNQGQAADMEMQQKRQTMADEAATRNVFSTISDPAERIAALYKVSPKAALALQKSQQESEKTTADISQTKAQTQETLGKVVNQKMTQRKDLLNTVNDPQSAAQWVQGMFADPDLAQVFAHGGDTVEKAISRIPTDPAAFQQWKQQSQLGADKLIQLTTPDANARLSAETARLGQASTAATAIRGQNLVNARGLEANRLKGQEIGVTREGLVGKKIQDVELKLQDDYRAESKGFSETSTAMKKILGSIETADKNPGSALAAGTAFMKILDPNSVVRESELGMALNASGWFDRALNVAATLQSGKVMTPTQKTNLKAAANSLFDDAKAAQLEVDSAYRKRAMDYGADPDRVIVNRGQNVKPSGKQDDIHSQADAILRGK